MRHKPANPLRKNEWLVDVCSMEQAQTLVSEEHYSRHSSHTAVFRHGLYRKEEWPLVVAGVALWLPPTRGAAEATYQPWRSVLCLSRLALRPWCPTNSASFLLSRSEKLIRQDSRWECLVTYADERLGHTGTIYLATGWTRVDDIPANSAWLVKDQMISAKSGPRNRTVAEMIALGGERTEAFKKRKFIKLLRGSDGTDTFNT